MINRRRANGRFTSFRAPEGKADLAILPRGFKALKQMTKMNYLRLHEPEKALDTYRELLSYTKVC